MGLTFHIKASYAEKIQIDFNYENLSIFANLINQVWNLSNIIDTPIFSIQDNLHFK